MCDHNNFTANIDIVRLKDEQTDNVIGYMFEATVKCAICGLPFKFESKNLYTGISNTEVTVSFDKKELRAPIKPSSDPVDHANILLNNKTDNL